MTIIVVCLFVPTIVAIAILAGILAVLTDIRSDLRAIRERRER